jgi:hypothetical protein
MFEKERKTKERGKRRKMNEKKKETILLLTLSVAFLFLP